jgi:hypothetical protein
MHECVHDVNMPKFCRLFVLCECACDIVCVCVCPPTPFWFFAGFAADGCLFERPLEMMPPSTAVYVPVQHADAVALAMAPSQRRSRCSQIRTNSRSSRRNSRRSCRRNDLMTVVVTMKHRDDRGHTSTAVLVAVACADVIASLNHAV